MEDIKNKRHNDAFEEKKCLNSIDCISFCLYFLIYFFEKDLVFKEENKNNFIKKIINIIFNDLRNLYMHNEKLGSKLRKIKVKTKIFNIYNELLDICNKNYKEDNFNLLFLLEKYNKIKTQFKNENKKEEETVNNENDNKEKAILKMENNSININTNLNLLNEDINIINKNEIKEETNISSIKYLKEKLSIMDKTNIYFKLIVGDDYPKEITKILFNPKEYYLWNIFPLLFKNYIFYNKKFINLGKAFNIHLNSLKQINNHNNKIEENFYLNYPTKLRNYIIDEYYRPFLKPCINFFNSEFLIVSHKNINEEKLKNLEYKEENINIIKYKRIIPKLNSEKYFCELFKNKGNIFGFVELSNNCLIFKNSPNDDMRLSDDPKKSFPFLFSIEDDKIIDKDKYILIFYDDIKEIIKRRVCLLYIGLEFFMKNNKSYMFNFFNKNTVNKLIDEIKKYTQYKNILNKNSIINNEEIKNKKYKNKQSSTNTNNDVFSNININKTEINFKLIEEPISEFKKLHLQIKNKKGDLSNFNYLLLINKYSSRTYNDYNQYLVFPFLYTDFENKKKRDLSKVICLNKENNEKTYNRAIYNYSSFKFHFNQHYSSSGFILHYLVRLIPFTYKHILFQAMKFDAPTRFFSSLVKTHSSLKDSDENRELIPEFYYSYDFLINLNYNDFGIIKTNEETYHHINNVDTSCKYSFPEFIIKSRNNLEKSDLSPWIDFIFGAKQTLVSEDEPLLFDLKSYEEFSQLEKIKEEDKPLEEKVKEIKDTVECFKFGITPAKVFNKLHEKMNRKEIEDNINISLKNEERSINTINKYIQKK